jgi:hypothetical protein
MEVASPNNSDQGSDIYTVIVTKIDHTNGVVVRVPGREIASFVKAARNAEHKDKYENVNLSQVPPRPQTAQETKCPSTYEPWLRDLATALHKELPPVVNRAAKPEESQPPLVNRAAKPVEPLPGAVPGTVSSAVGGSKTRKVKKTKKVKKAKKSKKVKKYSSKNRK